MALGRLEDPEAEDDLLSLQRKLPWHSDLQPFIALALARIEAGKAVTVVTDREQLAKKVGAFMRAAKVSLPQVHKGALWYREQLRLRRYPRWAPFEVQVMRQVAEMAGEAYQRGVWDAFKVSGFNFTLDHAAQLKVRLGQMERRQRIQWLVEHLSKKRVLRWEDEYEMQALADEGIEASRWICEKLKLMRVYRNEYHDNGFCALFRTLKCIGDPEAVPIVRSFLNDNDRWIRHDAQDALQYLEQGWRVVRAVDY